MATIAFFGFPARGHTVPSLPIVAELARRGVAVEYYSTPPFRALIEAAGARFVDYPVDCESLSRPRDLDEHLVGGLKMTARLLPRLLALRQRPDLILFDASAMWGDIFARHLGIPAVASITTFAMNRTMLQLLGASAGRAPAGWAACDDVTAALNSDYGAGIHDHLDLMVPRAALKLVYTSRLFQPAGRYFDSSHLFLGPLAGQRPREGERVCATGTRPLAYVSLGTIFNRNHALLRRISQALVVDGWQVVVSLGEPLAAGAGERWPEHVRVHAFVDQIGVLAKARLLVTHGGMNSVSEALARAVPMVILPQGVDQYLVAKHTADLGAALVIDGDDVSESRLRAAFSRIQREGAAFEAAAARIQASFEEAISPAAAVDSVLALLRTA